MKFVYFYDFLHFGRVRDMNVDKSGLGLVEKYI